MSRLVLTGPAQQFCMAKQLFSVARAGISINRYGEYIVGWNICIGLKHHLFQISLVTDCTVRRIGDLPFTFSGHGTCGTFMINSLPTTFFCFEWTSSNRICRSLTRKNNNYPLSRYSRFIFDSIFELNRINRPGTAHSHYLATIANYLGLPLIMGGSENNKLEILNTTESPPAWIEFEGTDYPYSKT